MKLTKKWKEDTIKTILQAKIKKETDEIDKEYTEFGIKYIINQNKKYQHLIDKLPKEYLKFASSVYFRYGEAYSEYRLIYLDKDYVVHLNKNYDGKLKLTGKQKVEFLKIVKKDLVLKKFTDELRHELTTIIMACTTVKMIKEVFSEVDNIENYVTLPKKEYPLVAQTDKLKRLLKS